MTDWLREQTLRTNLEALETQAGTPAADEEADDPENDTATEVALPVGAAKTKDTKAKTEVKEEPKPRFSDGLIRWARLSPPLAKKDIAPYLVFAASFKSLFLSSEALPESIRDMATQLLSRSPTEARRVTDEMLRTLQTSEVSRLIRHIGGVIIDEPQKQSGGVIALLRIARAHADAVDQVVGALQRIKPADLKVGGLTVLQHDDDERIFAQLTAMAETSGREDIRKAVNLAKEDA